MSHTQNIAMVIFGTAVLAAAIFVLPNAFPAEQSTASVIPTGEYTGTTTQSTPGDFPSEATLRSTNGSLAQVTITGSAAGTISLYDATTSDVTKRTGNTSTSSIYLASFPANASAGTYTFDRKFQDGLLVTVSGVVPTSTITWR